MMLSMVKKAGGRVLSSPSDDDGLSVRGVSFTYAAAPSPTLLDFSVNVPRGSISALLGPSGSGKTTLLNLLAGYLVPDQGQCFLGQARLDGPSPDRFPIYQSDGLLPWFTVADNVRLVTLLADGSPPCDDTEVERCLSSVGLPLELLHKYPKVLSGGMRKRCELARILHAKPSVILADEPFSSLDVVARYELYEVLKVIQAHNSMTILLSTHDIHEALYLAEYLFVLKGLHSQSRPHAIHNTLCGQRDALQVTPEEYSALYQDVLLAMRSTVSE